MDQFTIKMAKFKKELVYKVISKLKKEDRILYILFKLHMIKLRDIMIYQEPHNITTACFKFNWFNPLIYIFIISYIIQAIICGMLGSIIEAVDNIKQGINISF